MTPKHPAATRFLNNGLFDDLSNFTEIEARISALPTTKEIGDAFEVFAEAYLATQKIAQAQAVWPFDSIPLAQRQALALDTGRDMGVDGLYQTCDGELRAYQVKFRSRRPALTWEELATFMGLTDQVKQRVLFTNCEALPSLMRDRGGFVAIRGSDLDRLDPEDFAAMRHWLQSGQIVLPRKQPRAHQQEALDAIATALDEQDRATVVMACGTGKSLVALWAAERRNSRNLLVLVPSLALVRQLLHEWLHETAWEQLTFLCVCSDPTVAKGVDNFFVHQADLDFPVTTESAAVQRFLSRPFDGIKLVFSTYQSAHVVADGLPIGADGGKQAFDLGIFDEAHKTAGRAGTHFSFALDDANLPIRKRLYFTATPRHYDIRKRDREGDSELVYSMDKPEIYGPVVHTLSFAEAARRGIICDYKVVISVVTSEMVNDHLLRHGQVNVAGDEVKARQVALQVALQKAVEKYGVRRIFTFHGSVAAARSFTSDDAEGIRQHLGDFRGLHVSGAMPTAAREEQMQAFRQADKAIISNARCLTEGVDVPAVDMVAFISPRKSKVDIVQATGRAMRKSPGKEYGYVMVPLFLEQAANETVEEALQRTGFDDIWDLLAAMKEQDDVLTDIIRKMREDKGRTGGYDESRFIERVEVLGPSLSLETIRGAITAECVERLGVSWDEGFGRLLEFFNREGHCKVLVRYRTNDGYNLGSWVANQRSSMDIMRNNQKEKLELVPGWTWDVYASQWEEGFIQLIEFVNREGHALVPTLYINERGFRLGRWVSTQRKILYKIPPDQKEKLESLPKWTWDVATARWEIGFFYLKSFAAEKGHSRVSSKYETPDRYKLGLWAIKQRIDKNDLPKEKREQLETLPGWSWDLLIFAWEEGFDCLKNFIAQEGHAKVPVSYETSDGYRLGQWVSVQRKARNKMSQERQDRLGALPGWAWNAVNENWEIGFSNLQNYVDQEGHARVPQTYETDKKFPLGQWVSVQRRRKVKGAMTEERIKRLEELPGWVWDRVVVKWDDGYQHPESVTPSAESQHWRGLRANFSAPNR